MTLAPGRFAYAPIIDRPIIRWPGNARVAFWVAPNMEFFEYMPESRPTQPDIPFYARMDYGNRVGFWRMLEVLNKHKVRACCCLIPRLSDQNRQAQSRKPSGQPPTDLPAPSEKCLAVAPSSFSRLRTHRSLF
jgi:hypothetical protein